MDEGSRREEFKNTLKCRMFTEELAEVVRVIGLSSQEYMFTLEYNIAAFIVDNNWDMIEVFDRIQKDVKLISELKKGRIWTP